MTGTRISGLISFALALFIAFSAHAEVRQLATTVIGPDPDEFVPGGQSPQATMFGYSVATRGDVALVGMPVQDGGKGRVAIFIHNDAGQWQRSGALSPPATETGFGASVIYAHDVAAVTAASGVYLYRRAKNDWSFTKKLAAPAGVAFGAISYDGHTLAVAAAPAGKPGAVYVYEGEDFKGPVIVNAEDAAAEDAFGYEVALVERTLVVGAPFGQGSLGAVYVFHRDGGGWERQQKLLPAGSGELYFGASVAIDGKHIVVGAPGVPNANTPVGHRLANQGAAYVFFHDGHTWSLQQTLQPTDEPGEYLNFGTQVRISGGRIAITSPVGSTRFEPATCLVYGLQDKQWVAQSYVFGEYSTGISLALSKHALILGGPIDAGGGYDIGHGLIAELPQ